MKIFTIVFCILSFVATAAFAALPLTTDDAGVVDLGKYELESGYSNDRTEDTMRNNSCGFSLKQGITERMDVGISFPYQIKPKQTEPLGGASFGLKFSLIKELLALSLSNELGEKEYFINGILSKDMNFATMHVNLGYLASGDEDVRGSTVYSWAFEHPVGKVDIVGEMLGEEENFNDWLLGGRYNINNISALSFGYGNGFKKTDEKIIIGLHTGF